MKKQYLFFDLGWTLEDETASQIDRARNTANVLIGLDIHATTDEILRRQEEGAQLMMPSVYRYALQTYGLDESAILDIQNRVKWNKALLTLYCGIVDVLTVLKKHHHLGIIANQSPGSEQRLQRYGIRHLFDHVFASAELGLAKPDPRIYALAMEKAKCIPGDAWMIGDRLDNDIAPANRLGWNTIRVVKGYNALQEPRSIEEEPDFTVTDLAEIVPIVSLDVS